MKKINLLLLIISIFFILTACDNNTPVETPSDSVTTSINSTADVDYDSGIQLLSDDAVFDRHQFPDITPPVRYEVEISREEKSEHDDLDMTVAFDKNDKAFRMTTYDKEGNLQYIIEFFDYDNKIKSYEHRVNKNGAYTDVYYSPDGKIIYGRLKNALIEEIQLYTMSGSKYLDVIIGGSEIYVIDNFGNKYYYNSKYQYLYDAEQ